MKAFLHSKAKPWRQSSMGRTDIFAGLWRPVVGLWLFVAAGTVFAESRIINLEVDATGTPRNILHSRLQIPVEAGSLTLLYPKWIPGDHAPTGPITDLVGLEAIAAGRRVAWQRDSDEMYEFHLEVPAGATVLEVALDYLLPSDSADRFGNASSSAQLVDVDWNRLLLYPKGPKASEIQFATSLRLPEGWKFGTALPTAGQSGGEIHFAPVSLETLVDSPLIAGRHFKTVDLTLGSAMPHLMHMVAENPGLLEMKLSQRAAFSKLVTESESLFGAHHYRSYHFLLTLSDHVAHYGLEHHESSDDRTSETYFTDDESWKLDGNLLPHELVHSWNGKYRRPIGLATPTFQEPMKGDLLWVYEGLTEYLGDVLAARSGIWTQGTFREEMANNAAMLEHRPGRNWRSLADTSVSAQLLYFAREGGKARRRDIDFYPEGALIWLEADVVIRKQSQGKLGLDDFCKKFCGAPSSPPQVVPYTYDDLILALNDVVPYDWRAFFQKRVFDINPHAPLGGIEGAGWRLAYASEEPELLKAKERSKKITDLSYSLGFIVNNDGNVVDVVPNSPAGRAEVGPDMKLVGVNGRRWSAETLRGLVAGTKTNSAPIELLVENTDLLKTCKVAYREGEKYPVLERDPRKTDLLSEILKPSPSASTASANRGSP